MHFLLSSKYQKYQRHQNITLNTSKKYFDKLNDNLNTTRFLLKTFKMVGREKRVREPCAEKPHNMVYIAY